MSKRRAAYVDRTSDLVTRLIDVERLAKAVDPGMTIKDVIADTKRRLSTIYSEYAQDMSRDIGTRVYYDHKAREYAGAGYINPVLGAARLIITHTDDLYCYAYPDATDHGAIIKGSKEDCERLAARMPDMSAAYMTTIGSAMCIMHLARKGS